MKRVVSSQMIPPEYLVYQPSGIKIQMTEKKRRIRLM